jgi:hypothetical protein
MPEQSHRSREEEALILQIELTSGARTDLQHIMQALGVEDLGDAIGAALGMEAFLLEEAAKGSRVVIIDKDGRQREVMIKPEVISAERTRHR